MTPRNLVPLVVAAASLAASACHDNRYLPGTDGDADTDVDADVDVDADSDADAPEPPEDADLPEGGGPVTMIVDEILVLEERMCDLDGDGSGDNSIADLGSPASSIMLMAMNNVASEGIRRGSVRLLLHYPWVDDPAAPEDSNANLIIVECRDGDDPPNPDDDFLGDEVYYANGKSLDDCGEPLFCFSGAGIHVGTSRADAGTLPVPIDDMHLVLHDAVVESTIEPYGAAGQIRLCGYSLVQELGVEPGLEEAGDLTLLEILLAGGLALGIPMVPGLLPDIDVDHDGLERFTLDEFGHIVQCIDGDTTVIAGRDCWADPRIADAFSLAASMTAVRASFGGRATGWEVDAQGDGVCESPPEDSLFDPR